MGLLFLSKDKIKLRNPWIFSYLTYIKIYIDYMYITTNFKSENFEVSFKISQS